MVNSVYSYSVEATLLTTTLPHESADEHFSFRPVSPSLGFHGMQDLVIGTRYSWIDSMKCQRRGIVAVEAALILPVLVAVFTGMITVQHMLYTKSVCQDAAATAAMTYMLSSEADSYARSIEAGDAVQGILDTVGGSITIDDWDGVILVQAESKLFLTMQVSVSRSFTPIAE